MHPLVRVILKNSVIAALSLALIGHLLARGYLMFYQMQSGASYDPANERVLWQAPLNMALIGLVFTAMLTAVMYSIRKPKQQQSGISSPTTGNVNPG
ncbi:MAG: hypothetical protein R3B84_07385 [Zavarzinella sp.]